jgi:hypothetical protein
MPDRSRRASHIRPARSGTVCQGSGATALSILGALYVVGPVALQTPLPAVEASVSLNSQKVRGIEPRGSYGWHQTAEGRDCE